MLEYAMLQQKGFNNFMLVQKASFTKICKKKIDSKILCR